MFASLRLFLFSVLLFQCLSLHSSFFDSFLCWCACACYIEFEKLSSVEVLREVHQHVSMTVVLFVQDLTSVRVEAAM